MASSTPESTRAPLRWGILTTGKIARTFATDLALLPDARVEAVAARRRDSAEEFTAEFGGRALDSYEQLATDPDVDVVYVASPHSHHHEHARMLLEAGKPVLCEKPLTLDAASSQDLVDLATERGVFFMEAMWMACNPVVRHVRDLLAAGELGEPRQLVADLGFRVDRPPTDRLLDPALGGGALLDMGIYPLTLAQLWLGEPARQVAVGSLADSGIDLDVAIAAAYDSGAVAALTTTITSTSPRSATLATTTGRLELSVPFHSPEHATWIPEGGDPRRIDPPEPLIGRGYGNEAAEVARCLRSGELQSPWVPHEQTLSIMRQMDALRSQLGVVYPGESGTRVEP